MPAIYGPGAPNKYQSKRNRTWKGQAHRRLMATANASINAGTIQHHLDALSLTQAEGEVSTWPALIGADGAQANIAQKGDYGTNSWPDFGGPSVHYDTVGEATKIAQADNAFGGAATVYALCSSHKTLDASGTALGFRSFWSGKGWKIYYDGPGRLITVAIGQAGAYQILEFDGYATQPRTVAFTGDAGLPEDEQVRVWIDGVETTPDNYKGTGMVTTFPAGIIFLGAESNNDTTLASPLGGYVRLALASTEIPTDARIEQLNNAAMWKVNSYG